MLIKKSIKYLVQIVKAIHQTVIHKTYPLLGRVVKDVYEIVSAEFINPFIIPLLALLKIENEQDHFCQAKFYYLKQSGIERLDRISQVGICLQQFY
jgi:hypothetical protein